jgi:L-threonylcarbamoyladenylate synthase
LPADDLGSAVSFGGPLRSSVVAGWSDMSAWFDCADDAERADGLAAAVTAVLNGELVVLPTDTVYGLGADAFSRSAVDRLAAARAEPFGGPRSVLVGTVRAAAALVEDLGADGQRLIDEFWPGGLTIVCRAARTLSWDLGNTKGTVAIRMPQDKVALELLTETGPMAVSSANRTGVAAATTAAEARDQLGDSVAVYLDAGSRAGGVTSTIVDLTGDRPRLLRRGAISVGRLREVAAVAARADPG